MPPYSIETEADPSSTSLNTTQSNHAHLDPKKTDDLLARELMQLSFKDRSNISEEVHGVHTMEVEENPETISQGLSQLQHELDLLPVAGKGAFDRANQLAQTYVNDVEFRLRFLRADLFDAHAAAKRMCGYLDLIWMLFGVKVLQRPLRADDFSEKEERKALRSGLVQLLPYRDRSGRRIVVILSDMMQHNHVMRVKLFLYLLTVAAECEETQRRGVLFVMWPGSSTKIRVPENEERNICTKSFSAFPARVAGFHFCWPDTMFFHLVRSFFVMVMGQNIRARVNFHSGQRQELSYKLMGFGIPVGLLPTTETGVIKTKNHMQWLKARQHVEKLAASMPNTTQPLDMMGVIECPCLNDVLYERSKPCNTHPGNVRFKALIEEKKADRDALDQTGKRDFAWTIVEEIEDRNGRFLKWDKKQGFWICLEDRSEIRTKVASSFRDFQKTARALAKPQTVASVCKVSFDNGQELKKRRIVVSDDESSTGRTSRSSNSSVSSGESNGCFPALFDFKAGFDVFTTAGPNTTSMTTTPSDFRKRAISPIQPDHNPSSGHFDLTSAAI